MIDVWGVAANGLWVVGLSVVVAALSWAYWCAVEEGTGISTALGRAGVRRAVDLGLAFFCAGLAATSRRTWERVVWGALGVFWVVDVGRRGEGQG